SIPILLASAFRNIFMELNLYVSESSFENASASATQLGSAFGKGYLSIPTTRAFLRDIGPSFVHFNRRRGRGTLPDFLSNGSVGATSIIISVSSLSERAPRRYVERDIA